MNLSKLNASLKIAFIILLSLIAIIAGYLYWRYALLHPNTDNAYLNANVINISPQVSGPISAIYVENNQVVKKDQPLFDILSSPFQAIDDQALAKKIQAQNNATRTAELVKLGYAAKSTLDDANAALAAAAAALEQAQLNLSFTHIKAPEAGTLVNFNLRAGSTVTAGLGIVLFSIIEEGQWWLDANFKETQLERIKSGQKATVNIDIYPGKKFKGIVSKISDGSGSAFSLLPPENATGNWIKVTQRFPVKIIIQNPDPQYPLRIGASATVSIDTR
jgi:membrane fusion protein (multidrug efflux system)